MLVGGGDGSVSLSLLGIFFLKNFSIVASEIEIGRFFDVWAIFANPSSKSTWNQIKKMRSKNTIENKCKFSALAKYIQKAKP